MSADTSPLRHTCTHKHNTVEKCDTLVAVRGEKTAVLLHRGRSPSRAFGRMGPWTVDVTTRPDKKPCGDHRTNSRSNRHSLALCVWMYFCMLAMRLVVSVGLTPALSFVEVDGGVEHLEDIDRILEIGDVA